MSLRLAYYGDDFTGSTDVMEVLAQAGVPTRLFLEPPTREQVVGLRAVGVAGVSRSLPTTDLDATLRSAFERLKSLDAPLVHYKVCSTFDSSPTVGSIGRAIEIGAEVFGSSCVPLVVGAPALGRYVAFGNLFARSGQDSPVFRLDRHPTMSQHPVTPMREADIRRILAEQTEREVHLIDVTALEHGGITRSGSVTLFDTVSERHLPIVGRAVWELARRDAPVFAVGSSGLEYALVGYWREAGELRSPARPRGEPVGQIVAVCGSCSPVTARQIGWAKDHGFVDVPLSPDDWAGLTFDPTPAASSIGEALRAGRSVIAHAATGPGDPRIEAVRRAGVTDTAERLGRYLGALLDRLFAEFDLPRVCVAGGDTSGFVARALGVESLEFVAPIAPGSPLCRVAAPGHPADGRQLCFKGGQVGKADFFELAWAGRKQD